MKRILAILKYSPTVLCLLLVGMWAASGVAHACFSFPWPQSQYPPNRGSITVAGGRLCLCHLEPYVMLDGRPARNIPPQTINGRVIYVGWPEWRPETTWIAYVRMVFDGGFHILGRCIYVPFAFMLTAAIPFGVGPFIRYRFPLWSWFCWIALLAAELAYYMYR